MMAINRPRWSLMSKKISLVQIDEKNVPKGDNPKKEQTPRAVSPAYPTPDNDEQCKPQASSLDLSSQNRTSNKLEPTTSKERRELNPQKPSIDKPLN
ncbi:hypothetical protein V6N13_052648 [Hibiscus sabdariffa]